MTLGEGFYEFGNVNNFRFVCRVDKWLFLRVVWKKIVRRERVTSRKRIGALLRPHGKQQWMEV